MGNYAIYLRKSRADIEAEASGAADTLSRHRAALFELAARQNLTITAIYEEVVSGETLTARPQMQALLEAVDNGEYAGVLCMEVERLARGDTIDQGIVARSFKFSGTKIITPSKTYDPEREIDEEYFEFGLFMARREYKAITRRLQRGREASVREGKFIGNKVPYGWQRVKLPGEKGFVLEPVPDQVKWVKAIFEWYTTPQEYPEGTCHCLGQALIAHRLNDFGVPSPSGGKWTAITVRGILDNPVHVGKIRYNPRPTKKIIENGTVKISRPRASAPLVVEGRHEGIISQEVFDAAQKIMQHPSRPGPKQVELKNPLSGVVFCASCGHGMCRRPYQSGRKETLICSNINCKGVMASDLDKVEEAVIDALKAWLKEFELEQRKMQPVDTTGIDMAIEAIDKDIERIDQQLSKAFELVETGVYSPETFVARSKELSSRRESAVKKAESLEAEKAKIERRNNSRLTLLPKVQHVIDVYATSTAAEKNELLKSVLERVEYSKSQGGRWKQSDMKLRLSPRMPD